jgi:integrase
MKKVPDFASAIKDDLAAYVKFMKDGGRAFNVETCILKAFDRFLVANDSILTDEETVNRYVLSVGGLTNAQYRKRYQIVRKFTEHRALLTEHIAVPPLPKTRAGQRHIPHWYTKEEIDLLLTEAGKVKPADSLRPHNYRTIIGLLACSGMRISEALNLDVDDVNLDDGLIYVRDTKFKKSRLLPLHPTATTALKKYAAMRERFFPNRKGGAFFVNNRGVRFAYGTFNSQFIELARKTGIRQPDGAGARIHDLRHTFAVNRISAWYDSEIAIHEMLPVLSVYLGHAHFEDTVYYLNISAELMTRGSKAFKLGGDSDE